jgi:hypothetical protein
MRYQFGILPEYGRWLYLLRSTGLREEDTLGVILKNRREGDILPVRTQNKKHTKTD